MSEIKPDIRAVMAEIRAQAADSAAELQTGDGVAPYQPLKPAPAASESRPTIYSDELNYLNAHWNDWFDAPPAGSHRRFSGALVTKLKLKLRNVLRSAIFPDYYDRQQQFLANLVRHLNDNARYIDSRVQQTFWETINKVDHDIAGINSRCDRLVDETVIRSDRRIEKLEVRLKKFEELQSGGKIPENPADDNAEKNGESTLGETAPSESKPGESKTGGAPRRSAAG